MKRAGMLSAMAATMVACSGSTPSAPPPPGSACGYDALVAASDYVTGCAVGGFTTAGRGFLSAGIVSGDPALSASNGRAFLVLRDSGHIAEIDPACGTPLDGGIYRTNEAAGTTDPQDVAVAPDRSLWVPLYSVPSVIQIGTDGGIERTISLGAKTYDPDGNPNASAIAILPVNGVAKAFVALEVLNDLATPLPAPYPDFPSLILQIDVATGAIDNTTALAGRNPFGLFVQFGGALWMAEPGDFSKTNEPQAGIERFDPQTRTSKLLVTEASFGASVAEVAVTSGCGAAIVADATSKNATSLMTFDPDTGSVLSKTPILATSGYDLQAMLWVGDVLLVGDRTKPSGGGQYAVHAFDLHSGCTLTEREDAIFLQLPPVAFQPTQ